MTDEMLDRNYQEHQSVMPLFYHHHYQCSEHFTTHTFAMSKSSRMTTLSIWSVMTIFLSLLPMVACSTTPPDFLDTSSIVLITGAAGFIGSELAIALHRIYQPTMIVCIDAMDNLGKTRTEEDFALLEYKRQRAFHAMQTLGSKGVFYRADFRPSIPEFFDVGEVPILDYIFKEYEITHIVHLADAHHRGNGQVQAVPRIKDDIKAGMMESLLEQIAKVKRETERMPHFTYASSYEVYNYWNPTLNDPNPPPFDEAKPITTPSSLRGAGKLMDEILGLAYYDKHQIYSLGLRFFPVYGPWGLPGTPMFEMAERAITDSSTPILTQEEKDSLDDVRDFVYIDDAVDAILAAMQFRTISGKPGVINVGTGKGTTLRDVARQMEKLMPRTVDMQDLGQPNKAASRAYASVERSTQILGFSPQVSLKEGLARLLAWHYDRAFPHGGRPQEENKNIVAYGLASCSPFDKDCLHGAPVYPCVSECSHENQCTTSYYDDVLILSRSLTSHCEAVLYTVALDEGLTAISSANMAVSPDDDSHMKDKVCNIAFVSETSPLVRRLKQVQGYNAASTLFNTIYQFFGKSDEQKIKLLQHGFWTLVPVPKPAISTGGDHVLKLLPKLSPGLFFGGMTRRAIYCDPNVIFTSIPSLLNEAKMQPYLEGVHGATTLLIGHDRADKSPSWKMDNHESVQNAAYRMIQIGVVEEITSQPSLDSSWMIHTLQNEDSRLFRCDIFGEIIQWDVTTDKSAIEFIVGLHDMWSRVIASGKGQVPWWVGDAVVTLSEGDTKAAQRERRRLDDEPSADKKQKVGDEVEQDIEDVTKDGEVIERDILQQKVEDEYAIDQEVEERGDDEHGGEAHGDVAAANDLSVFANQGDFHEGAFLGKASHKVESAFQVQKNNLEQVSEAQGAFMGSDGDNASPLLVDKTAEDGRVDVQDVERVDGQEDDETTEGEQQKISRVRMTNGDDTWLGVLSSTQIHYFVRIVPSLAAGVVFLQDVKY